MKHKYFLLIAVVFCQATLAMAQHVSLSFQRTKLERVLSRITEITGYTFTYSQPVIDVNREVTIEVSGVSLPQALNALFKGTNIAYEISEKKVFLTARNSDAPAEAGQNSRPAQIPYSGTVSDRDGNPIPGASVSIKGTATATVTDGEGGFRIPATEGAVIAVSYVGFLPREITLGSQTALALVLQTEDKALDEVVVVGYGTQKKSNITGSVASIRTKDFEDLNIGVTSVIQGRVAGVNVSNGNIIIRGAASVNGADPLWIVDGVPGSAPNFNDIESIEILKDAASTAIYGARGAGGVILVTTKKGRAGSIRVNARANLGIATPIDIPEMLQTPDFIDRKIAAGFPNNPESGWDNPASLPNTDWKDLVWRNATRQNHFVQVTGGSEKTTFNSSAEFYQNDQIERHAFERGGNIRFASQTNLNKKLKISEIITLGFTDGRTPMFGNEAAGRTFYRQVPTMLPYDLTNATGGGWGRQPPGGYYEGPNPVATIESVHINNKSYWGRGNLIFDWNVIEGLDFQANFAGNFNTYGNNLFQEYWSTGNVTMQERYTKDYRVGHDLRMLYTLTYNRVFAGKHDVKGMAGYEAWRADNSTAGGWKTGFNVQPAEDMSLGTGSTEALGGKGLSRSISQFARINYAYDDKYLFEASIRRDGYDNFGPENRWGVFPSASAGWNVARESFIRDNSGFDWLSQLKLRASIGRIGNNTVAQFLYEPAYTNNFLYYSFNSTVVNRGFWYSNIANVAIKWEDVTQWNAGIDMAFLSNRLNATIEYYDKRTTDMLYSVGAPPSSGAYTGDIFGLAPSYTANIGEISNKGFEGMVQWADTYRDFRYDVAFTVSTNRNKVIRLSDQINPIMWAGTNTALNSSIYRTENGQPMGQVFGYVVDGIFQEQSEIDILNAGSADGLYQQAGTAPGDFRYRDINGDGKITVDDKAYIGNPWPEVIYGMNISLSWKGFDLVMGWLANTGMSIFNSAKIYERSFYGDYNTTYKVFDAWTPENRNTGHPRVTNDDPNGNFKNVSSYFVEDGSFLKLNNLHFGYNLPGSFVSRFHLQGVKLFVNCDNLFTITGFQGDPELGGAYLQRNHYTERRFPATRLIMGGLSFIF